MLSLHRRSLLHPSQLSGVLDYLSPLPSSPHQCRILTSPSRFLLAPFVRLSLRRFTQSSHVSHLARNLDNITHR